MTIRVTVLGLAALMAATTTGCGDDGGTEADRRGVGAQCAVPGDCMEMDQACLTQFKGGYCGVLDCVNNDDCPEASVCVAHDDGHNYCFRTCVDKVECNRHRDIDNEANCSASITFVEAAQDGKACVPPSSGT